MASKLMLIVTAVCLFSGLCEALDCVTCSYSMVAGQESQTSSADCKGNSTNTNLVTCGEGDYMCSVVYSMTDETNYSWSRMCSLGCTASEEGATWTSCCDSDGCNKYDTYREDQDDSNDDDDDDDDDDEEEDDEVEKCYSCTYTEENGVNSGPASCKTNVTNDAAVTKVNCTTNCFIEKLTDGNMTTWTRGCRDDCTTIAKAGDADYLTCCQKNECNGVDGTSTSTSGADVIIRSGNFLSAIVVVAMVIRVTELAF